MTASQQFSSIGRAYVALVVVAGATTIGRAVYGLYQEPLGPQWLLIAFLTLLTGSFTVKVPSINASLSVSETFVFASVLLFGPDAGAVTVLLECLIILFWMRPQGGRPIQLILFNTAAPAIAIWTSGTLFFALSKIQPYSLQVGPVPPFHDLFVPLLAFTLSYFLLNSWLVAFALSFETHQSAAIIWWDNFPWLAVNYFSGASVAALLVTFTPGLDLSTLAIIVPLLVVSYLTFRTAMGRVEDSNRHLSELNRLYLSTIETLAMAIDAKDQRTHGHIRRVQAYAVGLAKHLGVREPGLIKAIEAAALLHDMGKLAIPEYILNKPGKLSAAEFDKMKRHATVGAEILSAIEFPYPVVPIVRHHHEQWNGQGYPDGLAGTDIPIGARILAVVDCFDALTSDRPYRTKLDDEQALEILRERRGVMYDPLVVDAFLNVHADLARNVLPQEPSQVLDEIGALAQPSNAHLNGPGRPDALSEPILTPCELASIVAGSNGDVSPGGQILGHLTRLIPFEHAVVFSFDASSDELVARQTFGELGCFVQSLRVPIGQRLSGWVGANRRTIVNSDPALDIGNIAPELAADLRSCISTPFVSGDSLLGVVTLYSRTPGAFNHHHQRCIEVVTNQVALAFVDSTGFDDALTAASISTAAKSRHFRRLLRTIGDMRCDPELSVLVVSLSISRVSTNLEPFYTEEELADAVFSCAKQCLRDKDVLFCNEGAEFIGLLENTRAPTAAAVGRRLQSAISKSISIVGVSSPSVATTSASAPHDGNSIQELVMVARSRLKASRHEPSQVHPLN